MAQLTILIIDEESGQQLGAQLKTILQSKSAYRIDLVDSSAKVVDDPHFIVPNLVMPVLPPSRNKAQKMFTQLRAAYAHASFLPVIRTDCPHEIFDDLLSWTEDFLITPLRHAEVCARIKRFIGGKQQAPAGGQMTETCGLTHLIGDDPAFLDLKRKIPL